MHFIPVVLKYQFSDELERRLPGASVPQAFINGVYFGVRNLCNLSRYPMCSSFVPSTHIKDLEKVSELNENRMLANMLEHFEVIPSIVNHILLVSSVISSSLNLFSSLIASAPPRAAHDVVVWGLFPARGAKVARRASTIPSSDRLEEAPSAVQCATSTDCRYVPTMSFLTP
jgi:hypothetical protein